MASTALASDDESSPRPAASATGKEFTLDADF